MPLIHAGERQVKWSWSPAHKPTESQWHRYDAYASRVRTIKFQDLSYARRQRNNVITVKLINALVSLHPRGAFCPPRLRKLQWTSARAESALAVVPFLCDTLEDLYLALHVGPKVERELIKLAAGRTPRLKSLSLDLADGLESSVVFWLSKLQLLESLSLPTNYETTAMMRALGDLAHLKRLRLLYETDPEMERADQCFSFNPSPVFPMLEELEIEGPLDQLVQAIQTYEQFGQLKQVSLSADDPIPEQVFNITTAVAQRCPSINAITLELCFSDTDLVCNLSFQHTRPLLACRSLKIVKFEISGPFSINQQDLEDMARAWPGIQELNLSSRPDPSEETMQGGFPLRLLPVAASLFPALQTLGIYIDPKGDVVEFDYDIFPSSEFQSLQVLDIGTSGVPNNDPVALGFIIGALCKLEIQIVGDFEPVSPYDSDDEFEWCRVQDTVTKLVRSKRAIHKRWNVTRKP